MTTNWHDLIQRYISGTITAAETEALEQQLKTDAALRDWYLDALNLDSALEASAESAQTALSLPVPPSHRVFTLGSSQPFRWLSWRPLTAAAAGIAIGMFCTSVVFGFVGQRQMRTQTLLSEGFEYPGMPVEHGLPQRAGVWSGDFAAPEVGNKRVQPAEGSRMVRLPQADKRRFSYAMRFIDAGQLPPPDGLKTRQIEVSAAFCSESSLLPEYYQIRMAAFAGTLAEARAVWLGGRIDEQALMHVARTISTAPGHHGWTSVCTGMEVPAQTNWVLVSLAAAVPDGEAAKTARYLDDVHIRVLTHEGRPAATQGGSRPY
jgi:hypothetical protein